MSSFGQKIRAARKRRGLTQAQAAKILGILPNSLARWERGEKEPPREADVVTQEGALRRLRKGKA